MHALRIRLCIATCHTEHALENLNDQCIKYTWEYTQTDCVCVCRQRVASAFASVARASAAFGNLIQDSEK